MNPMFSILFFNLYTFCLALFFIFPSSVYKCFIFPSSSYYMLLCRPRPAGGALHSVSTSVEEEAAEQSKRCKQGCMVCEVEPTDCNRCECFVYRVAMERSARTVSAIQALG